MKQDITHSEAKKNKAAYDEIVSHMQARNIPIDDIKFEYSWRARVNCSFSLADVLSGDAMRDKQEHEQRDFLMTIDEKVDYLVSRTSMSLQGTYKRYYKQVGLDSIPVFMVDEFRKNIIE